MAKRLFILIFCLGVVFGFSPARAAELSFSAPIRLTTLPWSEKSNYGVPLKGAEWLVVDSRRRFWVEAEGDFQLYGSNGHYLRTVHPVDESGDFYGFASMEALNDGRIVLLARLESRVEQAAGDDFELRSKPGARLVVLDPEGKVAEDQEEVDQAQPHSDYVLESGNVYSVHNDGTYQILDSSRHPAADPGFKNFAAFTFSPEGWRNHLRTLPVFRSENRVYHDILGRAHVEKNALSFLMGHSLVESSGPLAERDGKIYYRVVFFENGAFANYVFVEDSIHGRYALIELIEADRKKDGRGRDLFVDEKGNLFEGVAQKEGYRIIEWKMIS